MMSRNGQMEATRLQRKNSSFTQARRTVLMLIVNWLVRSWVCASSTAAWYCHQEMQLLCNDAGGSVAYFTPAFSKGSLLSLRFFPWPCAVSLQKSITENCLWTQYSTTLQDIPKPRPSLLAPCRFERLTVILSFQNHDWTELHLIDCKAMSWNWLTWWVIWVSSYSAT